jgi:hypothetical protein
MMLIKRVRGVRISAVRSLLRSVLATSPSYTCQVAAGHIVVYPDRLEFRTLVQGVDLVDRPRGVAAREYIDFVSKRIDYFKNVGVLLGGVVESPIFDERVSLGREARVIDHLGQLLGRDKSVFFVIQRAPSGGLLFSLGSVR